MKKRESLDKVGDGIAVPYPQMFDTSSENQYNAPNFIASYPPGGVDGAGADREDQVTGCKPVSVAPR